MGLPWEIDDSQASRRQSSLFRFKVISSLVVDQPNNKIILLTQLGWHKALTILPVRCSTTQTLSVVILHEKQGRPVITVEEYDRNGEMVYGHLVDSFEKMIQAIKRINDRI